MALTFSGGGRHRCTSRPARCSRRLLILAAVARARGALAVGGIPALGLGKCGVAVSSEDEGGGVPFNRDMLQIGAAQGLAWHTHWKAATLQPGFSPWDYGEVRAVPQIWGKDAVSIDLVQNPSAGVLLGFNEPDSSWEGGSGVAVEEALGLWMHSVEVARLAGYTMFVAPSIAQSLPEQYTGIPGGSDWLPRFLEQCLGWPGCPETITFLGFHLYEPKCITDPAQVRYWGMELRVGSMKKLMADFNSRGMNIQGLWLTEFAGRSDEKGLCGTLAQQRGWMELIVPMLNEEPAVVAYSWFSYGEGRSPFFHDNANLWAYQTNQLNELGEAYFRLCERRQMTPVAPPPPPTRPPVPLPPGNPAVVPPPAPVSPPPSPQTSPWRRFLHSVTVMLFLLIVAGVVLLAFMPKLREEVLRAEWLSALQQMLHFDMAMSRNRLYEFPLCSHIFHDGGGLQEDQRRALEELRVQQPALAAAIESCCMLVADRQRFAQEADPVFDRLRRAVAKAPAAPSQRILLRVSAHPQRTLADAPAPELVWEFVLSFAESNPARARQVAEVVAKLEQCAPWQQALRDRPSLMRRRAALAPATP